MDAPADQQKRQVVRDLRNSPETLTLTYDTFRHLMEVIYAKNPNDLRNWRRVCEQWQAEYLRISAPENVKTLCLVHFDDCDKLDIFEKLNARFFGAIDLDKAVFIRLTPQAKLRASMLEAYYPSVTQLVISQHYLKLTNRWKGKITHFSLMVDADGSKLDSTDLANRINSMTALTHLDMDWLDSKSYLKELYVNSMELMQPTLRQLEHFSVNLSNVYSSSVSDNILPQYLNPKCTRLWFVEDYLLGSVKPMVFKEGYPSWLSGLTHLCIDLDDTQYESNMAINRLTKFAPKLQHLRLLSSNVDFSLKAIYSISGLAQLNELHIGFNFYADGLHDAFRNRAIISRDAPWTCVRTLVLSAYAFNQAKRQAQLIDDEGQPMEVDHTGYGTALHFIAILSAVLPNVQHLTIIGQDRYPFNILEYIPLLDGFPKLLSFNFKDSRSWAKLTGKRETPEEPFRTNENEVQPALLLLNVVEDPSTRRNRPKRARNFWSMKGKIIKGRRMF